ncbi:DUF5606 family protein [Flavitalea sp.]|nr:DUF5606 domain-containing protein [Flavitalea sp.]
MEYGKIISVTGMPGLYELLSSKNDGAIVRSLDDKSTKFVSSRIHNFSHLESIEIYTVRDNVNLVEIFQAMDKSSEKIPDGKDAAVLKKYFETVYPDIDFERVYTSDLKKMAKWLQVLKSNDVELKLTEAPVNDATEQNEGNEEPVDEQAIAKPTAKKSAKDTAKDSNVAEKEAPSKAAPTKAPAKDKKEPVTEDEAPKKKAAPKAKKETDGKESESKEPVKKKAAPKKKS